MNCADFDNPTIGEWVRWAVELAPQQPEKQAVENASNSESESDVEGKSFSSSCLESKAYHDYWRGSPLSGGEGDSSRGEKKVQDALDAAWEENEALGWLEDELSEDEESDISTEQKVLDALSEAWDDIDEFGNSPLHRACSSGMTKKHFLSLIKDGHDVNRKNKDGDTALHIAVRYHRYSMTEVLIDSGASCDIQNNTGETALHLAAKVRRHPGTGSQIFELVLRKSAHFHLSDTRGVTPLMLLAKKGDWSGFNRLLEKHGCSDQQDIDGNTVLHHVLDRDSLKQDQISGILSQAPHLAKIRNLRGDHPFHMAARKKSKYTVTKKIWPLFSQKEALEAQDQDGSTPLHILAKENKTGILRRCLKKMADLREQGAEFSLDIQDSSGKTVLSLLQQQIKSVNKAHCEQLISKIKGAG